MSQSIVPLRRVFSHFDETPDGVATLCKGEVQRALDKTIGKTIYRIQGTVPNNFVQQPPDSQTSLRMMGEFVYAQLLTTMKPFVIHVDVVASNRSIVRFSLGNVYTTPKAHHNASGTVVQLPAPPSMAGRWTVVALDIVAALAANSMTAHLQFLELKAVQVCSSTLVRNVYNSGAAYTVSTLPRDMKLPVPQGKAWGDTYCWEWVGGEPRPIPEPVSKGRSRSSVASAGRAPCAKAKQGRPPLLAMRRIAGYSGDRSHVLLWSRDGNNLLYACTTVAIVHDLKRDEQRFLLGHTNAISAMALSTEGNILATAQEGRFAHARLWNWETGTCIGILRGSDRPIATIEFSPDDQRFVVVSRGPRAPAVASIWDISAPTPIFAGKYIMEVNVRAFRFSPLGPQQFVTCGHENIRFWRVKGRTLHSAPVALGQHVHNTFSDVAFETVYPDDIQGRRVFVSTMAGSVFQIHGPTRTLQCIYQVHSGAINSIVVNESFCVTGSDDAYVRVWPLDFSDYFLEAHHDASITSLDVSSDGLAIAIGTEMGAVGMLSVGDHTHHNVLRSHSNKVTGLAIDPHDTMISTASADGTVRIWSLRQALCQQLYEFEAADETPRCVVFRSDTEMEAAHIACGFDSGAVRIFVVEHTKLLFEYSQHQGAVYAVAFAAGGQHMLSLGLDNNLCIYDACTNYSPMKVVPIQGPRVSVAWPETSGVYQNVGLSLAVSSDSSLVAAISAEGDFIYVMHAPTCREYTTVEVNEELGKLVVAKFMPYDEDRPTAMVLVAVTSLRQLVAIDFKNSTHAILASDIHDDYCRAMAVSPDGKWIATGGDDRLVKLWAFPHKSGKPVQTFIGHSAAVLGISFDNRGSTLITVGEDETVCVWEVQRGHGGPMPVEDLVAEEIAAAAADLTVAAPACAAAEAAPAQDSEPVAAAPARSSRSDGISVSMSRVLGYTGGDRSSSNLEWHQSRGWLAYMCGRCIVIDDLTTKEQCFLGCSRNLSFFVSDPMCTVIAGAERAAGEDGFAVINVWSLLSTGGGAPAFSGPTELKFHDQGVACMDVANGLLVSVGADDENCVMVWDAFSGKIVSSAQAQSDLQCVKWFPASPGSARHFVTAGDGSLSFWLLNESMELLVNSVDLPQRALDVPVDEILPSYSIAFVTSDPLQMVLMSPGGQISLWDTVKQVCLCAWGLTGPSASVCGLLPKLIAPQGLLPVTTCQDSLVQQWQMDGRTSKDGESSCSARCFSEMGARVVGLDFSPVGDKGVVGVADGSIHFVSWTAEDNTELICSPGVDCQQLVCVGDVVAAVKSGGAVAAWDTDACAVSSAPIGQALGESACTCLSDLPGDTMLVLGMADGSVKAVPTSDAQDSRIIHQHDGMVTSLATAGDTVVSANESGTLLVSRLWRGELLRVETQGEDTNVVALQPGSFVTSNSSGELARWHCDWSTLQCVCEARVSAPGPLLCAYRGQLVVADGETVNFYDHDLQLQASTQFACEVSALSACDDVLAVALQDGALSVSKGDDVPRTIGTRQGTVTAVCVANGGSTLLTAGADGSCHLYAIA